MNLINGQNLEFGNRTQTQWINSMAQMEKIADKYDRHKAQRYYEHNFPEIMFRKNYNYESSRWTCPQCGVDNFIRVHAYQKTDFKSIITPRIYACHNSRCPARRFYWRDGVNTLWARFLGKYEVIDELEFVSNHDPLKFYSDLKPNIDPKQISMF